MRGWKAQISKIKRHASSFDDVCWCLFICCRLNTCNRDDSWNAPGCCHRISYSNARQCPKYPCNDVWDCSGLALNEQAVKLRSVLWYPQVSAEMSGWVEGSWLMATHTSQIHFSSTKIKWYHEILHMILHIGTIWHTFRTMRWHLEINRISVYRNIPTNSSLTHTHNDIYNVWYIIYDIEYIIYNM